MGLASMLQTGTPPPGGAAPQGGAPQGASGPSAPPFPGAQGQQQQQWGSGSGSYPSSYPQQQQPQQSSYPTPGSSWGGSGQQYPPTAGGAYPQMPGSGYPGSAGYGSSGWGQQGGQQGGYPGQQGGQQQGGYPGSQQGAGGYPGSQQQGGYPGQQQQGGGYPGSQQQQGGYPGGPQQGGQQGLYPGMPGAPGQQGQYPGQQQGQYPGQQGPRPGHQQTSSFGAPPSSFGAQPGQMGGYPGSQQPGFGGQQSGGSYGSQQSGFGGQQSGFGGQQSGFGGAPGQQQQGGPVGPGQPSPQAIQTKLQTIIQQNRLEAFYPPQALQQVMQQIQRVDLAAMAAQYRMPMELAISLCSLALYDTCIFCDDSGSMAFEEGGERIDDLKLVLQRSAEITSKFDSDGILVRFMNSPVEGNGITSPQAAQQLLQQVNFNGMTPLGSALDAKVIRPFFVSQVQNRTLKKPILCIIITDGEPTGEPKNRVAQVISQAKQLGSNSQYGPGAIAFEFAQVGKDTRAQAFLAQLDNDPVIGQSIDATSYYELEAEEYRRKGVTLTPDVWLVKLLCGAIDRSFDEQD